MISANKKRPAPGTSFPILVSGVKPSGLCLQIILQQRIFSNAPPFEIPRGEKFSHEGGHAVVFLATQTFFAGGWVARNRSHTQRTSQARPKLERKQLSSAFIFCPFLPQFLRRFATVAIMAQALQVAPVREYLPVALVINHMVHIGRSGTHTLPGASSAEWLPHKLCGSQIIQPFIGFIHPAPAFRLGATVVRALWLMLCAITVFCQSTAPRMSTGSHRLLRHGLSPPANKKSSRNPMIQSILDDHGLWSSTLWPLSIFSTTSCLHFGQYTGRFCARSSNGIRSNL